MAVGDPQSEQVAMEKKKKTVRLLYPYSESQLILKL